MEPLFNGTAYPSLSTALNSVTTDCVAYMN